MSTKLLTTYPAGPERRVRLSTCPSNNSFNNIYGAFTKLSTKNASLKGQQPHSCCLEIYNSVRNAGSRCHGMEAHEKGSNYPVHNEHLCWSHPIPTGDSSKASQVSEKSPGNFFRLSILSLNLPPTCCRPWQLSSMSQIHFSHAFHVHLFWLQIIHSSFHLEFL